jgi:hypothetical protein
LAAQQFVGPTSPAGWTSTALLPNDYIGINVSGVATVTRVTLILGMLKL